MIAHRSQVVFARQHVMEPRLQRLIIRRVNLLCSREIAMLCSDCVGSVMLGSSPEEMCEFDMHKFLEEVKNMLLSLLIS
jgi:hypothetical protein